MSLTSRRANVRREACTCTTLTEGSPVDKQEKIRSMRAELADLTAKFAAETAPTVDDLSAEIVKRVFLTIEDNVSKGFRIPLICQDVLLSHGVDRAAIEKELQARGYKSWRF